MNGVLARTIVSVFPTHGWQTFMPRHLGESSIELSLFGCADVGVGPGIVSGGLHLHATSA